MFCKFLATSIMLLMAGKQVQSTVIDNLNTSIGGHENGYVILPPKPLEYIDDSIDYDCTGNTLGRICRSPSSCYEDFQSKCFQDEDITSKNLSSRCCPEQVRQIIEGEALPLSISTNCLNRKCKRFYGGWWSPMCRENQRTLFYCPETKLFCCSSACRPTDYCRNNNGECVTLKNRCDGRAVKYACKGHQCYCCIKPSVPPTCPTNGNTGETCTGHRSCVDHYNNGAQSSGVYTICPFSNCNPVLTYCDMDFDGGPWTVFVSRNNKNIYDTEEFAVSWADYKKGFGNCEKEFWLGNEILHNLTNSEPHELSLVAMDENGVTKWLKYDTFVVGNENSGYQLSISGYNDSSTLGPIFTSVHPLFDLNGIKFSTRDVDNDNLAGKCTSYNSHCGFWYNSCAAMKITDTLGVQAYFWEDGIYSPVNIDAVRLAIRPVSMSRKNIP